MIVAGRVVMKMLPVLQRIWLQMPEPKWCISMGACASTGGVFDTYAVVQGIDRFIPVDIYVPGCPPRPEQLIQSSSTCRTRSRRPARSPARSSPGATESEAPLPLALDMAPSDAMVAPGDYRHRDAVARRSRQIAMTHGRESSTMLREQLRRRRAVTTSEFRDNRRVIVPPDRLFAVLECLKDECGFDMLVEMTAVDYLHYPDAKDRFGVVYVPAEHDDRRAAVRQDVPERAGPDACRRRFRCGRGPTGWSAKSSTCTASSSTAIRTCAAS